MRRITPILALIATHTVCVLHAASVEHVHKDDGRLEDLFSEAFMLIQEITDGSEKQKLAFSRLLTNVAATFDVEGYRWMLDIVKGRRATERFTQAVAHRSFSQPHCDKGSWVSPSHTFGDLVKFPGGPFRGGTGYDLVRWMGNQYSHVHSPASANQPGLENMIVQAFQQIKGVIQTILAVVVDLVPPIVISVSLPCLPMLTGINCLGSVLYPISATDFVMADITDSVMNGVISSFPAKYAAKVGRTSDAQYYFCAHIYLGMYCASLFPICVTGAAKIAETFPMCFVQCIAALIACPGFWMDDIAVPCSNLSVPPFCSFSVFANHYRIPPQYTTYDQSHMYPEGCPQYNPEIDTPRDLYDKKAAPPSAIAKAAKEKPLEEFHLKRRKVEEFPGACDCDAIKEVCRLHLPYPVYVGSFSAFNLFSHRSTPTRVRPRRTTRSRSVSTSTKSGVAKNARPFGTSRKTTHYDPRIPLVTLLIIADPCPPKLQPNVDFGQGTYSRSNGCSLR